MTAIVPLCALAAACSSADDADTRAPPPDPVLTSNPVMTTAPDGSAMTPGEWFVEESGEGAQARFGTAASEPLLDMECDRATRTLTLTRAQPGAQPSSGTQTFVLAAGGLQARLDMTPVDSEQPTLRAAIDRTQPVFRGFSQMGSVITMTSPDGTVLRMPGAPGISRVIEACA